MPATLAVTELFLDRRKVIEAMERANKKGLNAAGREIRFTARDSMKKRKSYSSPGSPPHYRGGQLRRLLFYSYDQARESVIVGPVGFPRSRVPLLLEEGGTVTVKDKLVPVGPAVKRGKGGRFESNREYKKFTGAIRYQPRPYMVPALRANLNKIPRKWKNAFGGL